MTSSTPFTRRPLTDEPWFWVHLFCAAALIALFLMQSKYGQRQSQLERQFQGRQHIKHSAAEQDSATPFSSDGATLITLKTLFAIAATGFVGSWGGLWWQRYRRRTGDTTLEIDSGSLRE